MRAQPRRGMVCTAALAMTIVAATPIAQSREARAGAATRVSLEMFEQWLLPALPASPTVPINSAWPAAPSTMDVEAQVAFQLARRYWSRQPPAPLMDGAARYLQSRAVGRMFDLAFGRAGNGVESIRLFGGAWTIAFPNLRFDGASAGLGRDDLSALPARGALAFASLERVVGAPRLIGALRSAIESKPATDSDLTRVLGESLAQDLTWLFGPAIDPSQSMNYRIAGVRVDGCLPAPCQRVQVEVAHDGTAVFNDLEVRVDFEDGQSASAAWDGRDARRSFTFEGPAAPVRVRIDPELRNLLDDNLLDQSREFGGGTNAPIAKWVARWAVWLQDAMLTYSALV